MLPDWLVVCADRCALQFNLQVTHRGCCLIGLLYVGCSWSPSAVACQSSTVSICHDALPPHTTSAQKVDESCSTDAATADMVRYRIADRDGGSRIGIGQVRGLPRESPAVEEDARVRGDVQLGHQSRELDFRRCCCGKNIRYRLKSPTSQKQLRAERNYHHSG